MGKPHAGHVLGTAACLTLPVALFAPKGLAPLLAIAALAATAVMLWRRRALPPLPRLLTGALTAVAALAAASASWSVAPEESLRTLPGLVGTFVAGILLIGVARHLEDAERRIARGGLAWGGVLGFALMGLDAATHAESSKALFDLVANGLLSLDKAHKSTLNVATIGALYLWPWAMALRRRFSDRVAVLGVIGAAAILFAASADAQAVALIVGGVVFGLGTSLPRQAPGLLALAMVAGVAGAPWIPERLPDPSESTPIVRYLTPSAAHRIVIWHTTAEHIAEKPVLGHGFDASRALYTEKDRVFYRYADEIVGKPWMGFFEPIPLHPHNAVLQVWLEFGAVGALALAGVLLSVLWSLARTVEDRADRALMLGLFTTGLAIASLSYGIWQAWWLCALLLLGGLAGAAVGRDSV